MATDPPIKKNSFLEDIEILRLQIQSLIQSSVKSEKGQFFTPVAIASLMASYFPDTSLNKIRVLDPGAGIGILSAVLVNKILSQKTKPEEISITAYENDTTLVSVLTDVLELCRAECEKSEVNFNYRIIVRDFIETVTTDMLTSSHDYLFRVNNPPETFDLIITNPPYKKILSSSGHRKYLRSVGIETTNLYSAFVSLALELLSDDGYMVAITPRSFCNGLYFRPFRKLLFEKSSFKRIHVFTSRKKAFSEDGVLQENIIYLLIKNNEHIGKVTVSVGESPEDEGISIIELDHQDIINEEDENLIIHIIEDDTSKQIIEVINKLPETLTSLGLNASTGQVVDFRNTEFLITDIEKDSVPLIYPKHFFNGMVKWPIETFKKPQAICDNEKTKELILKNGYYVITKRFSSKEEFRRIVAVVNHPENTGAEKIAFENHINYFHHKGKPLAKSLAIGLSAYLNSSLVDSYFRLFSGHTQVNASDLYSMKFPMREQLEEIGNLIGDQNPTYNELDVIINRQILSKMENTNPMLVKKRISDITDILRQLGIPKAQQNERSALTLLALLDLKPTTPWRNASDPKVGITEMMMFFEKNYGKKYAPNSRETVRRFTVHQFVQAGIVLPNPDETRAINSPNYVYQVENETLELIRSYSSKAWDKKLLVYLSKRKTLIDTYAQRRFAQRISILNDNFPKGLTLSHGKHNDLIKEVSEKFYSYFIPNSKLLYLGDTEDKDAYFDQAALSKLGIKIKDGHGKFPDIIFYYKEKKWLILIEAVTSHGPVTPHRKNDLEEIFQYSKAGLVFVSAFPDRKTMIKYLKEIAWETEIWIAEEPDHMMHLNGERFLGPYPTKKYGK